MEPSRFEEGSSGGRRPHTSRYGPQDAPESHHEADPAERCAPEAKKNDADIP